ncbi:MAG: hypothetical protein ISR45_08380 [Rhodospirillales bacterium]|nr:hypothetical protein [Rhodospirillales bacterium]
MLNTARFMCLFAVLGLNFFADDFSHASDMSNRNRGPFSDPGVVVSMPDDWLRQGIRHKVGHKADLAITLDQQLYPIILPLIHEFAAAEKKTIAVENGTCGISAGSLSEKTVDIGGYCCPPGELDRLPGLRFHTLGIGAIALIENPLNQLENISLTEVRNLFGGQMTHWSQLPVSGFKADRSAPIKPVTRLHCKSRPGHWKLIIDDESEFSQISMDVSSIQDMIRMVSGFPFGIGYETLWHIQQNADRFKVKILKVGGNDPSDAKALARGDYPFYRVFNLTTWENSESANPLADKLVEFLLNNSNRINPGTGIVTAQQLRKNGWAFAGNELVGEPGSGAAN